MRSRFVANLALLFTELPFLDRPAAAAAAGFEEIEVWWPFAGVRPSRAEIEEFVGRVNDGGVRLVGLNFFDGDRGVGDRGLVSDPRRVDVFRETLDVAMEVGAALGIRNFNALYGNRIPDVDPAEQDAVADRNLAVARDLVAEIGGQILIEPLSAVPAYPIKNAEDAATVIKRVGGIHLLLDVYHLAANGVDIPAAIRAHHPLIGHVQLADFPDRHEPGTGRLPLATYLEDLATFGYGGRLALEYIPAASTVEGLERIDWTL